MHEHNFIGYDQKQTWYLKNNMCKKSQCKILSLVRIKSDKNTVWVKTDIYKHYSLQKKKRLKTYKMGLNMSLSQ